MLLVKVSLKKYFGIPGTPLPAKVGLKRYFGSSGTPLPAKVAKVLWDPRAPLLAKVALKRYFGTPVCEPLLQDWPDIAVIIPCFNPGTPENQKQRFPKAVLNNE